MASWKQGDSIYEDNPFAEPRDIPIDPRTALMASSHGSGPSWLEDEKTATQKQSPTTDPNTLNPEIPRMILYTRVTNIALSVVMIMVSLLSLLTTNNATTGVLACYVVVFSCLLCCFETHLTQISKFIALNFGFMYSAKSRAAFMFFLGTILFSFSLFGKIVGCLMLVNAGFNIYILFKHPEFDEAQRNSATSDIKDYLASNPAFAQQFISLGVQAAAENPDVTKNVVSSYFGVKPPPSAPPQPHQQQFASV